MMRAFVMGPHCVPIGVGVLIRPRFRSEQEDSRMQRQFIKVCTALGVVGMAGTAMAGDTTRFDVSFSDVDIFPADFAANEVPSNPQSTDTADPGRYVSALGWSNVDVDVCWNTGASYSGWASEVNFAIELEEAGVVGWFYAGSPFDGDNTGSDVEGACSNRQALAEAQTDLLAFTYQVDSTTGLVGSGIVSVWGDGTGLRHSFCNTGDFFFVLAGGVPQGCQGATGSCGEVHPTPGCEDVSCCAITCDINAGGDSFCCDFEWDSTCVDLAVALCGIYQYSCDAPAYANDCADGAISLNNGDTIAFNTAGANTDGPDQAQCNSSYDDLPIWSDLWYMVEVDADAALTATCCNTATFDTKIAIYDAGAIGSTFDPATLPDVFLTCNEDCANDNGFFTSEAFLPSAVGGRQYLIRVGGYAQEVGTGDLTVSWTEPEPQLPAPECATPGGTTVSQFVVDPAALTINGGVWCGPGAENVVCRTYPAASFGGAFDVSCVDFTYFYNDEGYFPCIINLYRSNQQSPVGATLELLGTTSCGIYGIAGYTLGSQSFEAPVGVDLAEGEFLMVEVRLQRQLATNTAANYGGFAGVQLADTDGSEGYLGCGGDYFGSMSDIGFADLQPYIVVNGDPAGGGGCTGDFNDDGIVNGADFGSILAAWGPCAGCPEDLNGDGQVTGADVGLLLSVWGVCP